MAMDKITKSFISIMVTVFVLVTFLVFFGGYAYELKWHINNAVNKVFTTNTNEQDVKIKHVDFRPYQAEMQERFKKTWQPPKTNVTAKIDVEYDILKDGEIRNIKIKNSSGNAKTDDAVLEAVRKASPLPPLPLEYDSEKLHVDYTFEIKAN